MKKLFIMISILFIFGIAYAEEVTEKVEKEAVEQDETVKENAKEAQEELKKEVEPKKAEEEAEEKKEEVKEEPKEETAEEAVAQAVAEAKKKQSNNTFKAEETSYQPQPVYFEDKKIAEEITKKWNFVPINISLGTSFQVGLTIAQLTHKNFEIRIGTLMLGPGFSYGSKVDGDQGVVPGLAFLGEVGIGKFFGNPLRESCFGISLGIGSKIIFDIRTDDDGWDDGILFDDPLYVDFLPIYLTYRIRKGENFYDISLRIPLVWKNGIYTVSDETKIYNGVPDMTLNFSFVF